MPSIAAYSVRTSLVLPVYNGAETLERALCSLEEQSHALDEIVVVNDGSTDLTGEIIATWQKRLPIVAIENPENKGLTYSLQHGVAQASGDLVFRLDADDVWLPNHVKTILELHQSHPKAVIFATRAIVRTTGPEDDKKSRELNDGNVRACLLWDNPLVHSAVAFEKNAYEKVGGYTMPNYAEDYDLWIRMLSNGRFAGSREATIVYHVVPNSLSRVSRQKALSVRFGLQSKAIRAFAYRHPLAAARIFLVVMMRRAANKIQSV